MTRTTLLLLAVLTLGLVVMAVPGTAQAATYYFSTSGSDSRPGTQFQPKQTLAAAADLMSPGNTILLRRGDIWTTTSGRWNITDKLGTSDSPILVADYGTGSKPVINFQETLTGGWSAYSGKYRHACTTGSETVRCFVNGTGRRLVATLAEVTDTTTFYADASYVYLYDDPGNNPVDLVPCNRNVYIYNCNYLTFQNLEFRGGGSVLADAPTSHLTFQSCDIRRAACASLNFTNQYNNANTHVAPSVLNCYVNKDWSTGENRGDSERYYGDGIRFQTAEGGLIQGNTVINQGHSSIALEGIPGYGTYGTKNCIVERNETSQPTVDHGYSMNIAANEGMCTGNIIRRNYFHDNPTGNQIGGDHNYIYSNILSHSRPDPRETRTGNLLKIANWNAYGDCISHHNTFVNNTIYDGYDFGMFTCQCPSVTDDPSSNVFKNNLIVTWRNASGYYAVRQMYGWGQAANGSYPTTQVWQNNNFWLPGGSPSTQVLTRDTWSGGTKTANTYTAAEADAAFSGWANNLQTDPLFVSSTPVLPDDFRLQSTSPVRAAGTSLSGISDFVDYYGNAWDPTNPSIGAIQYTDPGTPPVADFMGAPTPGVLPLTVDSTDSSSNSATSLVLGTKRIPYHDPGNSNEQPTEVRLADGTTVALAPRGQITVTASGREVGSIAFQDVARHWLDQESLWGGHKGANDLRYLLRAGTEGELTAISDLTPVGDAVLAVLTWRTGGSGLPIAAQYLVRIEASPQPALVPLLRLPLPYITDDAYLGRPPGPRLFRVGERLLVYTRPTELMYDPGYKAGAPAELTEVDPTGRAVGIFATAPASLLPRGLLAERWLVLVDTDSQAQEPVWLLDLTTRTLRPLPGHWRSVEYGATRAFVPSTGSRILVSRTISAEPEGSSAEPDGSGRCDQTFLVHIPSGERKLLPGASIGRIWEGYVIAPDGRGMSIYSAETGELVQRVRTD